MSRWFVAPRWLAFHAVVIGVVLGCAQLGHWQLDRARTQHAQSMAPVVNAARTPVAIDGVLRPGTLIGADAVGRRVVVTGAYDETAQVLVPDRTLDGATGTAVLTPLVTAAGNAVVVDRGFLPATTATIPPAPTGTVVITGWLAPSEDAPPLTLDLAAGELGSIHLPSLANEIPYPLYDGYVLLGSDVAQAGLVAEPPPTRLDSGSWPLQNVFYAIEWWFFGLAALAFWIATVRRGPVARVARTS